MGFQEDHVCLKYNLLPIYVFKYSVLGQRSGFFFLIKMGGWFGFGFCFFSLVMCSFETNSYFFFAEILHIAC